MNKANLNHDSVTSHNPQTFATGLGFMAILFWSTTIAFSRSLSEQIGTLTTAAAVYLLGGLLGCLSLVLRGKKLRDILALPHAYLGVCGALFAIYALCLYLAIGLAADRHQVMAVGVINYLWPGLTLAFSVPILKRRARAGLLPGIALAFAGVVLAMVPQGQFNLAAWAGDMARGAPFPDGYRDIPGPAVPWLPRDVAYFCARGRRASLYGACSYLPGVQLLGSGDAAGRSDPGGLLFLSHAAALRAGLQPLPGRPARLELLGGLRVGRGGGGVV